MEKVTLFLCDICGTFDLGYSFKFDCDEIKRFVDNLNKLRLYNGTDKIIFLFVTTENMDTVILAENQLKLYINTDICIGKHIYSDGVHEVNKPYDIITYIKKLELLYNIDNNIYYADDSEFFHLLLGELKEYLNCDYEINSIIPRSNGLSDVNIIIENLCDNFSKKKVLIASPK